MRRTLRCLLATALLIAISAIFGLVSPASAVDLRQEPDPSAAQTNGRVQNILYVDRGRDGDSSGDRIYLGGSFTEVDGEQHSKLAALDANTGEVIDTWDARTNGQVLALAASPDGERIYAGGSFTSVNGAARNRLVALDAVTGDTVAGWDAEANNDVYSLATLDSSGSGTSNGENDNADRVYFGGRFDSVNGDPRTRLAAVEVTTGELDPNWTPRTDGNVRTLVLDSPNNSRLYVGGNYSTIGEPSAQAKRPNLAALDPGTGGVKSWNPNPRIDNNYEVFDLAVTQKRVHVAGGGRDPDGTAESFNASTGASVWNYESSGDFQAVALLDGTLYFGGHFIRLFTDGGEIRRNKFMAVTESGNLVREWQPIADRGIWAMTADPGDPSSDEDGRIFAGGDFTEINRQPRQGFAQFLPASQGP